MTLSSGMAVRILIIEAEGQHRELTLGSGSGSSCHLSSFQAFVVAEKATGSISTTSHQRFGVFTRLADFDDIFQLNFTNLSSRELQFSTTANRFSFFQLLDLGIASRNEFGLVRCVILSFPLAFSPLRFFIVRLALIFQAAETLAYRSGGNTSLFVGSIVETGGSLLLEGNIRVVLCER